MPSPDDHLGSKNHFIWTLTKTPLDRSHFYSDFKPLISLNFVYHRHLISSVPYSRCFCGAHLSRPFSRSSLDFSLYFLHVFARTYTHIDRVRFAAVPKQFCICKNFRPDNYRIDFPRLSLIIRRDLVQFFPCKLNGNIGEALIIVFLTIFARNIVIISS